MKSRQSAPTPEPGAAPRPDQSMWTLRRGLPERRAVCLLRQHPLGVELHISVNGEIQYSQIYDQHGDASAYAASLATQMEATGWERL